jgi:hypothetical protein
VDPEVFTPRCNRYHETKVNEDYEGVYANAVRLYLGVFWCFCRECGRWKECADNGVKFYWAPLKTRHMLIGGKYNGANIVDEQAREIERLRRDLKQFTGEYR